MKGKVTILTVIVLMNSYLFSQDLVTVLSPNISKELETIGYNKMSDEQKSAVNEIIRVSYIAGSLFSEGPLFSSFSSNAFGPVNYYALIVSEIKDSLIKCSDGTLIETSSYVGRIASGNDVYVFQRRNHWELWANNSRASICQILKTGRTKPKVGELTWILRVSGRGNAILLSDGTWLDVSIDDTITANKWSYNSGDVLLTEDGYLINLKSDDKPIFVTRMK